MITATFLAVLFVPVFYVAIQHLIELRNGPPKAKPGEVSLGTDMIEGGGHVPG
jgi:hypothetical protein